MEDKEFSPTSIGRSGTLAFLLVGLWLLFLLAIILIVALTPLSADEVNEIIVTEPPQSSFRIIQWISEILMILH